MSTLPRSLPFLVLPLSACIVHVDGDGGHSAWSHSYRGSGVRAEEDRAVGEFRAIELETGATVRVEVGGTPSLHLVGDDNLLQRVETRVENGVLSIDLDGSCSFRCGLELVITTPELEGFTIEGSGDVEIRGLAADQLSLSIEGSGDLTARGSTRRLTASIEGSGSLDLDELEAERAELSIEGSGSIAVRAAQALRYSIEGSGDIRYSGDPDLGGDIEGSGSIARR